MPRVKLMDEVRQVAEVLSKLPCRVYNFFAARPSNEELKHMVFDSSVHYSDSVVALELVGRGWQGCGGHERNFNWGLF